MQATNIVAHGIELYQTLLRRTAGEEVRTPQGDTQQWFVFENSIVMLSRTGQLDK